MAPPFKLIHEERKRPLVPKTSIKKRDIIIREYDDFYIQAPEDQLINQKFRILQDTSTYTKTRPPIRETSQTDEKISPAPQQALLSSSLSKPSPSNPSPSIPQNPPHKKQNPQKSQPFSPNPSTTTPQPQPLSTPEPSTPRHARQNPNHYNKKQNPPKPQPFSPNPSAPALSTPKPSTPAMPDKTQAITIFSPSPATVAPQTPKTTHPPPHPTKPKPLQQKTKPPKTPAFQPQNHHYIHMAAKLVCTNFNLENNDFDTRSLCSQKHQIL